MRGSYRIPGVHVRWQDVPVSGATREARMDIAGFAGIASRGPIAVPVRLDSWSDFIGVFGDVIPEGYLGYAVRGFFENGGRTCWVVRVADRTAAFEAGTYLLDEQNKPIARLTAASPGSWGTGIEVQLAHRGARRFDLSVNLNGEIYENWSALSLDPRDPDFIETVLDPPESDHQRQSAGSRLIRARVWYRNQQPGSRPAPMGLLDRIAGAALIPRLSARLQGGTDGLQPSAIVPGRAAQGFYAGPSGEIVSLGADGGPLHALKVLEIRPRAAKAQPVAVRIHEPKPGTAGFLFELDWRDAEGRRRQRTLGQSPAHPDGRTLSIDPLDADYIVNALADDATLADLISIRDLHPWPGRALLLRPGIYPFRQGLSIGDFVADPQQAASGPGDEEAAAPALESLGEIWDIGLLALPDLMPKPRSAPTRAVPHCADPPVADQAGRQTDERGHPPDFSSAEILRAQQAMLRHALASRYRFAILDPLPPGPGFSGWHHDEIAGRNGPAPTEVARAIAWREHFGGPAAQFGALYFPWIAVAAGTRANAASRLVPPSGHIAGLYARTDNDTGVHKAPANAELIGARATSLQMPDAVQGLLNGNDVNVVKAMANRGVLVYGARTLVRIPLEEARRWRYVNVRRLVSMVQKSIDVSAQWTVFEPNDRRLWQALDRIARSLLSDMWQRGMLDGVDIDDAFFVRCDEATNPPEQVDNGQVVTEVGLRPPWPAEFITLRLVRTAAESRGRNDGAEAA